MRFRLVDYVEEMNEDDVVYLLHTTWDDWFRYNTKYRLYYKSDGEVKRIGETKIAQLDMVERKPQIPCEFEILNNNFYSLGTDSEYYANVLNVFPSDLDRKTFYEAIRDVAFNLDILENVKNEDPFTISLSRGIKQNLIEENFHRMANGYDEPVPFSFSYIYKDFESLDFNVNSEQKPVPSNIHAIVGRNGSGKSTLLKNILMSISEKDESKFIIDEWEYSNIHDYFSKALYLSFSIFDEEISIKPNYSQIGMPFIPITARTTLYEVCKQKYPDNEGEEYFEAKAKRLMFVNETGEECSPQKNRQDNDLANSWTWVFMDSLLNCFERKPLLWRKMMRVLYSDPQFANLDCIRLIYNYKNQSKNEYLRNFYNFFSKLSSGHKIVMLSLTKIIELAENRILIVVDEPELYLHPPLVSSYVRCLSELTKTRNGIVIVATHSPIVLQEVSMDTVHKIDRQLGEISITKLECQTFGQSINTLMAEVFSLEVEDSGFINIIDEIVASSTDEQTTLETYSESFGILGRRLFLNKLINKRKKG